MHGTPHATPALARQREKAKGAAVNKRPETQPRRRVQCRAHGGRTGIANEDSSALTTPIPVAHQLCGGASTHPVPPPSHSPEYILPPTPDVTSYALDHISSCSDSDTEAALLHGSVQVTPMEHASLLHKQDNHQPLVTGRVRQDRQGASASAKPAQLHQRLPVPRSRTVARRERVTVPRHAAFTAAPQDQAPVGAAVPGENLVKAATPAQSRSRSQTAWKSALAVLLLVLTIPAALRMLPAVSSTAGRSWMTGAARSTLQPAAAAAAGSSHGWLLGSWGGRPRSRLSVRTAAAAGDAAGGRSPAGDAPASNDRSWLASSKVRVLSVVPASVTSPYKARWGEVMAHISQRLTWTDESFQMITFSEEELSETGASGQAAWQSLEKLIKQGCQVFLAGDVASPTVASQLSLLSQSGRLPAVRVVLDSPSRPSPPELQQLSSLQGFQPLAPSPLDQVVARLLPWSTQAKSLELWNNLQILWNRHSSDDLLFVLLVLINGYVTPVKEVYMTTKGTDLPSLYCMITKCGREILDCVNNPICKAGLDCLQGCSFNDQVCQYRCIVSYETPQFSAFSLCILQKHNCRNLDAKPPTIPDPRPMTSFRGAPMTHEAAESMLLGWMTPEPGIVAPSDVLPFSWLVAGGKNPAYDHFPCQHQLFTRGKGKGVLWYEPVFKAITLDGREVWRRRRYRVKRGAQPGTFYFSVLDNGVTSDEFWRILDCDEQYQWCLFYYSGAAATAGLSYSGAVLGTHDGHMPTDPVALDRLGHALRGAGIQTWELTYVDNSNCVGAPLQLEAAPA